jgi:hypothetical protein
VKLGEGGSTMYGSLGWGGGDLLLLDFSRLRGAGVSEALLVSLRADERLGESSSLYCRVGVACLTSNGDGVVKVSALLGMPGWEN